MQRSQPPWSTRIKLRAIVALVALCGTALVACGGGNGGAGGTPGGGGAGSPPTISPGDACSQTPSPSAPSGLQDDAATFFGNVVPGAHRICISMWDFSTDSDTALTSAAHNGASITIVIPYSQKAANEGDADALAASGAHVEWEYTGSQPSGSLPANESYVGSALDVHAKFALVDGIAYLDGHNWFASDVVLEDGTAGDFNAMQTDLTTFPAVPPSNGSFTTDKQQSLADEAAYVSDENPQTGSEYDFVSEDFNPSGSGANNNGAVYAAMCTAAAEGATLHVVVEDYGSESATAKAALANLLLLDHDASVRSSSGGLEKISMVRGASSAWFGSSNDTTTDLIDWGMTIGDASVIAALQSYYDGAFAAASPIPSPSPGTTPSPCPS